VIIYIKSFVIIVRDEQYHKWFRIDLSNENCFNIILAYCDEIILSPCNKINYNKIRGDNF
jgi:hypothetical protein